MRSRKENKPHGNGGSKDPTRARLAKEQDMTERSESATSFDVSKVPSFVERVETVQDEIDDIMEAAREECAPLREDIEEIKKEAHEEFSIPRRELNAKISERRARRKADAIRDRLSPEQQDNFDQMSKALGELAETPLGKAALSTTKGKPEAAATH